jgi:DNA-binding winged helix-turn-helix (wHTH) protein/tetratricopeptide (TPR) repeat protein
LGWVAAGRFGHNRPRTPAASLTTSPNFLYEFGCYELNVDEALLLRNRVAVPLPPKTFEVLTLLVRRAGTLVDRDTLMRELWPDSFVEDANIARHIWTLRQVFGADDYIDTIPKRGYRFTAPVRLRGGAAAASHPGPRVIVLPFRLLAPDTELEYLPFGLSEAIATSLHGLDAATIRSSAVAMRYAGDAPDLERIARDAGVDRVVTGTILRSGDRLRAAVQILEAPSGRLAGTASSEGAIEDLFQLQDHLVTQIAAALVPPLGAREQRAVKGHVPASGAAYESYLRANQLAQRPADHPRALALYLECVNADPGFAAAWARLGRLYRVMSKYQDDGSESFRLAEHALERALALNPDLPLAHTQYALLEIDLGRGLDPMTRLITRARTHRNDADVLAGLVHVCRFAGLLDASIAAHRRAVELDPLVATSVLQSYWMSGDVPLALAESSKLAGGSLRAMVLALAGRDAEAIAYLTEQEAKLPYERMRLLSRALRLLLEGDRANSLACVDVLLRTTPSDPEARYFYARYLARLGETDRANDVLASAVFGGFCASRVMAWDPWLDTLRSTASFRAVQTQADARYAVAVEHYMRAGGEEILGPGSAT